MATVTSATRLALVLAAFLPGLAACTGDSPPSPAVSRTSAPSIAPSQARRLEADLRSGTTEGVRAALALPSDQPLDPRLISELKGLSAVHVLDSTFQQLDERTATVEMTTQATVGERRWMVTLVRPDDSWLIALTEPLP